MLTNTGTIVGGGGGPVVNGTGTAGLGGAGVYSTGGATVINEGTISGGRNPAGKYAAAIDFTGGGNMLQLVAGHHGTFNGAIVVTRAAGDPADTLDLGGDSGTDTFDLSLLDPGTATTGFNVYEKTGASGWTLTGTGLGENWLLEEGTLQIGSSDGSASGSVTGTPGGNYNGGVAVTGYANTTLSIGAGSSVIGGDGGYNGGYNGGVGASGNAFTLNNAGGVIGGQGGYVRGAGGANGQGDFGGTGGAGVLATGNSTITNAPGALIVGGAGGYGYSAGVGSTGYGGAGGAGVTGSGFNLTNQGEVGGGAGGAGYGVFGLNGSNGTGGTGGAAVSGSGFYVNNSSTLNGGGGGAGYAFGAATGGDGGAGVAGTGFNVANSGLILGGHGGYGHDYVGGGGNYGYVSTGGAGGAGISVDNATGATTTIGNAGNAVIAGGEGGTAYEVGVAQGATDQTVVAYGGNGGAGIVIDGTGTTNVTNAGILAGGYGGYAYVCNGGPSGCSTYTGHGGTGGAAVDVAGSGSATITNTGYIYGGRGGNAWSFGVGGGSYTQGLVGTGGAGINVSSTGTTTIDNSGGIYGGDGGYGYGSQPAAGGAGVTGTGFTLTNSGGVYGGYGSGTGSKQGYRGGAGGAGASGIGFSVTNTGLIQGGDGGVGNYSSGAGGAGVSGSGFVITNTGTVTGGNGGNYPGNSPGPLASGAGGAGVYSTGGATVINEGTISGGRSGDGSTQADAIDFTGGGNTLELVAGHPGTVNGAIVVTRQAGDPADTLGLGGDSGSDAFDLSLLATGGVYAGFNAEAKFGGSTWTLAGTGSSDENWTIEGGTLVGDATALQGNLTFAPASGESATVVFDQGSGNANSTVNGAFAGVISGDGHITKQGNGVLTLTGDNTYSGGTTISAGTLQVGDGGTTGSIGTGDMADNGTLVFDRSSALAFAGAISGNGTLTQAGTGTLTLDGDSSSFAGSTEVQSGALVVGSVAGNGAALGGDVTVDSGATLGGHGSIGGDVDVQSGGHVAPGNSIGTLTVDGNFAAEQGSQLDYEFGAPSSSSPLSSFGQGDSIKVGGDLTLNGATLNISDGGGMGPGLYNVFTYGGTLTEANGGLELNDTTGSKLVLQNLMAQKQINLLDTTGVALTFWNANGKADATRMGGGDGTWSAISPNWTDSTGTLTNAAMTPQPGFAVFGGDAGTVTVDGSAGTVSATGMQFAVDGYTLTDATLTLVKDADGNAPVIRVGDGSGASAGMTATIGNVLAGSDGLTKNDGGTLVLTGDNTFSGGTTISAGALQLGDGGTTGSLTGDVTDNGALVFDRSDNITFAGVVGGAGDLIQQGSGTLTLNADSSAFAGTADVASGMLVVGDDAHAAAALGGTVAVAQGAALSGIGTIGGLDLVGTLSPGGSIGTLHVTGDATFEQGSVFNVEAAPDGSADQLAVGGKVTIDGGSVVAIEQAGNWAPQTTYTIISAGQGVSGVFGSISDNLAFLTPVLGYGANAVSLTLARNDVDFADVAQTPNQKGAATGAGGLEFSNPVYNALVNLNAPTSRYAFDQISGEYHATQQTARINDSRYVREAMNRRLHSSSTDTEAAKVGDTQLTAWAHAWGHWGTTDSDGNAGRLADNGDGLLIGADLPVGQTGRVGVTGGASRDSLSLGSRASWGRETSQWLGAFGGFNAGALALRGGVAYGWDQIPTSRSVAFPGFEDRLSGNVSGDTVTGFVEGAWTIRFAQGYVEPFLNLAHTRVETDAGTEAGGAAALHVDEGTANVSFSTLGARGTWQFAGHLDVHGELGWQHAYGDTTPERTLQFVAGGPSFVEYAVPVAKNAGLGRVGLGWHAGNVAVTADYEGLAGGGVKDQAAKLGISVAF